MRHFKPKFLTVKQIQEVMRSKKPMPTAIFSAQKKDYIVKARTIFGTNKNSRKGSISW